MTAPTADVRPESPTDGATDEAVDRWWHAVGSAALVGTARRPVPELPPLGVASRPGGGAPAAASRRAWASGGPETALLDAAALGSAVRRAGRVPDRAVPPAAAAEDAAAVATPEAVRLLELLLVQPPAGARLRDDLVLWWCREAARHGRRAPHRLLPALLDLGARQHLRAAVREVVGHRGAWLARQRRDWAWAATGPDPGPDPGTEPGSWARLPAPERVEVLRRLRRTDPGRARALLLSTWDTDPATARAAHLQTLARGLAPGDEPVLEAALDDRAVSVRHTAAWLLDGLPGSARAARMQDRLAPLVTVSRRRGRSSLTVALPDTPDAAGVRDGLDRPPPGTSQRGHWLQRIVAGAPLGFWTDLGTDPADVLARLDQDDVRRGLARAALTRGDRGWALALLRHRWDDALLAALDPGHRERLARERLTTLLDTHQVVGLLEAVPGPWDLPLSSAVLARLAAGPDTQVLLDRLGPRLAVDLHPDSAPLLRRWLAQRGLGPRVTSAVSDLLQFQSLRRSITEAHR